MEVPYKPGDAKGGELAAENAFLKLQLQEYFELIEKKDAALVAQKREVDSLYGRAKGYILMQDHLYKDFVRMEKEHEKALAELTQKATAAEDRATAAREQVKAL